ncbi:hypothetical protein K0M31_017695 [Melipona bicolor]|uniref:Uncharacterized protein n=1 Tax=Melipona bicolor TaxID=60889 RepID=A0AA40G5F7_9HYME|nr:hypothetical protein K0M31_017695 [Melipona bicolor]
MRADNSMKRICQDFCQWVETLGGTDNTIDEEVLRDMFEIDFSADACRATQVKEEYRLFVRCASVENSAFNPSNIYLPLENDYSRRRTAEQSENI